MSEIPHSFSDKPRESEEDKGESEFLEWQPFASIPNAAEWQKLKRDLFDWPEGAREQPHGLDLRVLNFAELNPETGKMSVLVWRVEKNADGEEKEIYTLKPGKTYFAMLWPFLRHPYVAIAKKYPITLRPRSSLLRAGIAARLSSFYGTEIEKWQEELAGIFDTYWDGMREAAFPVRVVNSTDVEVESGAPFVQAVISPLDWERTDVGSSEINERNRKLEDEVWKRSEPLHLGSIKVFTGATPRLTKDPVRIDISEPVESEENRYNLRAGTAYILESAEKVTFTQHEVGMTESSLGSDSANVYNEALIDAGYKGGLMFLVVPKNDLTLNLGDEIGRVARVNVPTTTKPYEGHYGE